MKKAKQYGIKTKGLNEEEVVRLARSKYMEEYWEKKAQNKKVGGDRWEGSLSSIESY